MNLRALALLAACLISIALAGCGDSAGNTPTADASNASAGKANALTGHKLVGAWEGAIEIDEQKITQILQDQAEEIDPAEAIAMLQSVAMSIDFHDDGTMLLSGTMNTPGGPDQTTGSGRWELVSENGQAITIRSIEDGQQGEEIELQFVDRDTFTMAPPPPTPPIGLMRFHRVAHVAHAGSATK